MIYKQNNRRRNMYKYVKTKKKSMNLPNRNNHLQHQSAAEFNTSTLPRVFLKLSFVPFFEVFQSSTINMHVFFVAIWIWFTFCCLTNSSVLNSGISHPLLSAETKEQIDILRSLGKQAQQQSNFDEAIQYYSAILQLVEGLSGVEAYEWRRRCGLTLAHYELKRGNFQSAIARCTEVIDESSNYLSTKIPRKSKSSSIKKQDQSSFEGNEQQLKESLQKAYQRRSQALKSLQKVKFAELDLLKAKEFQGKVSSSQMKKLKKLSTSNFDIESTKKEEEALRDFVEECQLNHPRLQFSQQELQSLSSKRFSLSKKQSFSGFNQNSFFDDLNQSMDKMFGPGASKASPGDLSSLFPSAAGDQNFSPLNSLFGQHNKKAGSNGFRLSVLIKQFGPMLGWDAVWINRLAWIVDTMQSIQRVTSRISRFVSKNKELLLILAISSWLVYNYYTDIQQIIQSLPALSPPRDFLSSPHT
jgi:tetratricopeptide (TPR) repeat protein